MQCFGLPRSHPASDQEESDRQRPPSPKPAGHATLGHGQPQPLVQRNAWKAPVTTTSWQPGQAVRLANLESQWLNGQVGTVVRQDPEKGKWVVRLQRDAKEVGGLWLNVFFC